MRRSTIADRPLLFAGHILIVEPKTELATRLKQALVEESHYVEHVTSIKAARELLARQDSCFEVLLVRESLLSDDLEHRPKSPLFPDNKSIEFEMVLLGKDASTDHVSAAFRGGVTDFISEPVDPEDFKHRIRRAIELFHLRNATPESRETSQLNQILCSITACESAAELTRKAPEEVHTLFPDCSVALFRRDHDENRFVPMHQIGMSRIMHREMGEFLDWFYKKSWRRFNALSMLRGDYAPWNIRNRFGRFNLLVPLRHQAGLWGAMLIVRKKKRRQTNLAFPVRERTILATLGMHLARTFSILHHYQANMETAFKDSTSGLFNDKYFQVQGEQALARARVNNETFVVISVNIRAFKRINDEYGHLKGGELLGFVGKLLRQALRETDIAARLAADHFAILLIGANASTGQHVLARIQELFASNQFELGSTKLALEAKMQLATFPSDGNTLNDLLDTDEQNTKHP